jgi:hypothetical protein
LAPKVAVRVRIAIKMLHCHICHAPTTLRDPPESSNQGSQPEGQTEIQTKEERREKRERKRAEVW